MNVLTYSVGQMQANCYVLIKDSQCLLIDPGDSADFILEQIQRLNLQLMGIMATHGHFDHIMAVGEIQQSFPEAALYIHVQDTFLIKRLGETAEHFLGYKPVVISPININHIYSQKLSISNFELRVIKTPGHTPGSCCFYFGDEHMLFTGDTLFMNGIGRYDFSYSDKDLLKQSLNTLFCLPLETVIYPGHGEISTIEEETKHQFF